MVTLKDIAEMTGVSISTVSRVLSNKSSISEETRQRVLGVAKELMFKKGIVSQTINEVHWHIGIVVPGSGEYFHNDPASSVDIRSIVSVLEQKGHSSTILFYDDLFGADQPSTKALNHLDLDGLIISDPMVSGNSVSRVAASGIPYLMFNGIYEHGSYNYVDYNNREGMKDLVAYVISKGYQRIAMLAGPESHLVNQNRYEGFLEAFREAGREPDPAMMLFGDFSLESGYQNGRRLMSAEVRPDAIVAFSDYIALGAIRAIKEAGLSVPGDVAITGFDDIELAQYSDPPLTTVRRYSEHAAELIVTTLERLIVHGGEIDTIACRLKVELLPRRSL